MTPSDQKQLDKMLRKRRVALMGGVRAMKAVAKLAGGKAIRTQKSERRGKEPR